MRDLFVRPKNNIAALDGVRALAIILVLAMHSNEYFIRIIEKVPSLSIIPPFKGGWVGVQLFFVLSGFLIGTQLWDELKNTSTVSFKKFFLRRIFRIWPIYYLLLFLGYILNLKSTATNEGIFSNIVFLSNYISDNGIFPSISWSLSTEEQFYIIAPLLVILGADIFKLKNLKTYRTFLIIILFFPTLFRYFTWEHVLNLKSFDLTVYMHSIYRPFHTNCEGLVAGLILSNIYVEKIDLKIKPLVLFISFLLFSASFLSKIYFNFLGITLFFSLLCWHLINSSGILNRIFSSKYFYPIGKTSYAIYLTHIFVLDFILINFKNTFIGINPNIGLILTFILCLFISFIVSSFLFYLVEKPMLKLRNKVLSKI